VQWPNVHVDFPLLQRVALPIAIGSDLGYGVGEGLLPEGLELIEKINATRKTPLVPFEKVGVTARLG
jgi:hypothetical protein